MFIMNSSIIVGYLLDLGGAAAKEVSDQAGLDFFGGNEKSTHEYISELLGKGLLR